MYAEILVNSKSRFCNEPLTYEIPGSLSSKVKIGQLVSLNFNNRNCKGIVYRFIKESKFKNTKKIENIILEEPLLKEWQLKLIHWISKYYFCSTKKSLELFLTKKVWDIKSLEVDSIEKNKDHSRDEIELTLEQEKALEKIKNSNQKIHLIHGVTGSGKTEIYLRLIKEKKENEQVLILVPEISLTPQMIEYFNSHFKDEIEFIHSKRNNTEKLNAWKRIYKNQAKIIIGSRSALFSPFNNLSMIIIDEEHSWTYKQESSPKYNTFDVAKKMQEFIDFQIILGSATPSIENYYHAKNEKINLIKLDKKVHQTPKPKIDIIDLREEFKKGNYSIFSEDLKEKIQEKLEKKEQILLFLNKRGSSSAIVCRECGYNVECKNCSVKMTHHKSNNKLICHHCGLIESPPSKCPNCQSVYIKFIGVGTEKVEEEVIKTFPNVRVLRADKDTTSRKDSFKKIYTDFKNHKADILIGTQMITKGLHLPKVNLVGVIIADIGLNIPDYKTSEKFYQNMIQVIGRAGRGKIQGEVIIQTYSPENKVIQDIKSQNYQKFFEDEISLRKENNLPPLSKLATITVEDQNFEKTIRKTEEIYSTLEKFTDYEVNMYPALIGRKNNKYRWKILVKGKNPAKPISTLEHSSLKIDIDPTTTI